MFRKTRLKLTAWYLLIIMLISLAFSIVIFHETIREIDRVDRMQRFRIERRNLDNRLDPTSIRPRPPLIDPELLEETKIRLIVILGGINFSILFVSGATGYFLAGRTLRPIKEMLDEQNRFIADASHELRTPLTAMKTNLEVNLRNNKITLPQVKETLEDNLKQVDNLKSLTDNLLLLTQYQKPNGSLAFAKTSLSEVIKESVKIIEHLAGNKKIKIHLSVSDHNVFGNRNSLRELFLIFLDNAVKYSPPKSLIKVTTEKKDGKIITFITDQGKGISSKDLPFIFDRFYRTDESRSKNIVAGFGLGLSIAKKIVDLHNGYVRVKNNKDRGCTFAVGLPISP